MATVGSFGIDLGLNTARFEEGLKRAGSGADRFQRGFRSAMSGLATAAAAASVGVAAVFAATKTAIDAASAINDASKAAGLAAETYQAWAFAAQLAGVEAESFAGAMTRANKSVGDAANGTGAAAKVFERLGIAVRDANGDVISTERVINQFADALAKMESPAEKAAAAAALFGREAGPKLVAMLEQGSSGMAAAAAEAHRLGAVIDADLIARADEAGDQLDAMSKIVSVQLTSALVSLTPVITAVAQSFANAAPHVARFFNILRGGNMDAIAGQMGTISVELERLRAAQSRANAQVEKDMFGRLIADAEKRLRELQAQYGQLMRGARPQGAEQAAQVPLGSPVVTGAASAVSRASAAVVAAAEDTGAKAGQKAGIAYARELSLAVDTSMKERADLDKFAVMTEAAAQAANEWAEQTEIASDRIAAGLESVVFAGFRDGVKGMRDAFNQALQAMILDLASSKLREMLQGLFASQGGGSGGSGNGVGGVLASVIGAFAGGGAKGRATGGLKGFAMGGSFTVPGPSTGDNVIPLFRANGGETVTVTPKGGGSGLTIVNNNDFRGADPGSEARLIQAQKANNEALKRQISDLLRRNRL